MAIRVDSTARRPGAATGRTLGGAVLSLLGVVLLVTGSFLPWLHSRQESHNSYRITGLAARLGIGGDSLTGALLAWWPLVGPLCMVPVVIGCLRWWHSAGWVAATLGLLLGLGAALVLVAGAGRSVAGLSLALPGPVTELIGAGITVAGGLVLVSVRPVRVQVEPARAARPPSWDVEPAVVAVRRSSTPTGRPGHFGASGPGRPPRDPDRQRGSEPA